jgi:hypothetical protein
MRTLLVIIFSLTGLSIFAQTNARQLIPGAKEQIELLLNKPAITQPVAVTPLGKHWFKLETDTHVFTDATKFKQVAAVLADVENTTKIFNGKRGKLSANIVSRDADEIISDFVLISIGPMGIHVKTPYRAATKTIEETESKITVEIRQVAPDSASNKAIRDLFAIRYAEEITIAGKIYTYIRIYSLNDVNTSILPGAKGILENNAGPSNLESLELIIAAAKTR